MITTSFECQKQDASWHTVREYSEDSRQPGWITLKLGDGCPELALSWRIADIQGSTTEAYFNVFEILWYEVDVQDSTPALYPPLNNILFNSQLLMMGKKEGSL